MLNCSKFLLIAFFINSRQHDIGLVKYETKALFLHLFYPTLLVVITVVQLQMFHKKYLERLELPSLATRRESSTSGIQPSSSVNYGSLEPDSPSEEHQKTKSHYTRINVSDLKNLTTKQAIKRAVLFYNRTKWFFDFFWLFMELHFIKVILLLAFLLGINEVSAVHIAIITLTVIATTSRTNTQTIYSGFISLTVASLFILKMIYQIEYIQQNAYNVTCQVRSDGLTLSLWTIWCGITVWELMILLFAHFRTRAPRITVQSLTTQQWAM